MSLNQVAPSYFYQQLFQEETLHLFFKVSVQECFFSCREKALCYTQPGLCPSLSLYVHAPPPSHSRHIPRPHNWISWMFRNILHFPRIFFSGLEGAFVIAIIVILFCSVPSVILSDLFQRLVWLMEKFICNTNNTSSNYPLVTLEAHSSCDIYF